MQALCTSYNPIKAAIFQRKLENDLFLGKSDSIGFIFMVWYVSLPVNLLFNQRLAKVEVRCRFLLKPNT